ncbi:MAG: metallophosphoesterase family protein [Nocardioidaceae bacterium]
MSRLWPFPDLRNGVTFHHITDTHFGAHGNAHWLDNWMRRNRQDMEFLKVAHSAHVHTGDCIHWDQLGDKDYGDNLYTEWRDWIKAHDGLPFMEMPGNHDLNCFAGGGSAYARSANQWASDVDVDSPTSTLDLGDLKIIGIAPDKWRRDAGTPHELQDYTLSQATLDWIDTELQTAGKPCMIASHVPLDLQFPGAAPGFNAVDVGTPGLVDVMDANPNFVGWVSGHFHEDMTDPNAFKVFQYRAGSRFIFGINSPPAGGGRIGVPYHDHQYKSINCSTFVTFLGDAIDVRWRDHNARAWRDGAAQHHIMLPVQAAKSCGV